MCIQRKMWAKESKHTIRQSSQAKLSCTKNVTSHLSRESRIFFFHIPSRNPETKKCELKNKPFIILATATSISVLLLSPKQKFNWLRLCDKQAKIHLYIHLCQTYSRLVVLQRWAQTHHKNNTCLPPFSAHYRSCTSLLHCFYNVSPFLRMNWLLLCVLARLDQAFSTYSLVCNQAWFKVSCVKAGVCGR